MLSEAVANLKIKVGEVALDGVRNE
jgi:hypothetical protein